MAFRFRPALASCICLSLVVSSGCTTLWGSKKNDPTKPEQEAADMDALSVFGGESEKSPKLLCDMGHVSLVAGKYAIAEDLYQQAIEKDSKMPLAWLGMSRVKLAQQRPEDAREVLKKACKKCPKSAELWNELSVAHATAKDYEKAVAAGEKAVELAPTSELFVTNLAGMLAVSGDYDRAFEVYAKVLTSADAHYRVAGVAHSKGKNKECIDHLRRAVESNPQHPQAAQMLAKLSVNEINTAGYLAPAGKDTVKSVERTSGSAPSP